MLKAYPYRSGVLFALVTAIFLGSITTQAKLYYAEGGNAMTLMLARFFISTLVFGLAVFLRREAFNIARSERSGVFSVGLVWSAAMVFYLLSVESMSVSLAVLILYAYPLVVLLYSIITGNLQPSLRLVLLFLAAFSGLYLALSTGTIKLDYKGLIFAVLASLGAAFTFIKGAKVAPLLKPLVMTFWINLIGLVMIVPLVISSFTLSTSSTGHRALAIATVFYVIAILCQFQALARLPATMAALILNLEPVVSILLAVIILKEHLDPLQWLGVALVITVLIVSIRIGKSPVSTQSSD
ncbi:MAG: DMT family transporter [Gammaproteobacteria bacterium]|nr:DMT family transporter [Gammaproteobacteria bacterium]